MRRGLLAVVIDRAQAALRAGCALTAAGLALMAPAVWAGDLDRTLDVEIPAQSLANALTALASQADLQILVSQELVAGQRSPAVQGHYTGHQVLQRLLSGTELEYAVKGRDTVVVHTRSTPHEPRTSQAGSPRVSRAPARNARPQDLTSSDLQEVVVTAPKRTQRIQNVPLAVTAVSAAELADWQINDTNSLAPAIPALSYQQGNNPTNTTFRIRGVGTALFGQGMEPSVSLVVDDVVQARQAQSFADLADIERIEVLEGPQGTLFGRNATGGVINVITALPSHIFAASTETTIAEDNEYRVKGTITGPIGHSLAYRLSGYYANVGGWIHNIATGGEYGGSRGHGLRGKLSWDPLEQLNVLVAADYRAAYQDCCHPIPIRLVNPTLIALYRPLVVTQDNTSIDENVHSDSRNEQVTTSVTATYATGFADLTSISAFQTFHLSNNVDVDRLNTPQPIYVGLQTPNYGKFDVNGGSVSLENFTQELRLSSRSGQQRLTYVAGLYYSTLALDRPFEYRRAICPSGVLGQPCPGPIYQSAALQAHLSSSTLAAFAQAEYPLIGELKLIAGVREQRDRTFSRGRTYTPVETGDSLFPGYTTNSGGAGYTNSATSGKGGLQYELSRSAQAYATYTRGYKGPGVMTEISTNWTNLTPILPETVDAYEVGYKGLMRGGHLRIAAAAFLARYDHLQVQTNRSNFTTGTNDFVPTNAEFADTRGVELQLTFRPEGHFSLNTALIYDEATFDMNGLDCPLEFQGSAPSMPLSAATPINTCYSPQVRDAAGNLVTSGPIQDVRGGTLPVAPRWRATLSPRYERPLPGNLEGFLQLDLTGQSKVLFALEQDPLLVQPAYTLTHLMLGLRSPDEHSQLTFFVRNLFDRRYFTTMVHNLLLAGVATPYDVFAWRPKDAGRYVGGTLSIKF